MIEPHLADDALLADIQAAVDSPGTLHLWWLGQSGFLVKSGGKFLLLDPYLSESLTIKYAQTDKPHVRMTRLAIDPSRLDFVDVVTSSHNHTDHLDGDTLKSLLEVNPELTLVVPTANQAFAADRLNVHPARLTPCDAGDSVKAAGFTIHGVPAAHEQLDRDEAGHFRYLGYVIECDGQTIYHSGDTMLYEGMVGCLRKWQIDVAILPINGRLPERRVAGNLWGHEAAKLARLIGARLVVPCHYDMFEFNTESPRQFIESCGRHSQDYRVLSCGERMTMSRSI